MATQTNKLSSLDAFLFLVSDSYKTVWHFSFVINNKKKSCITMTINYNNKEIELRFTFRADMLFENATGVTFTGKNESEWLQYFFCTLVALTKDESMRFDDFLDWISEPQNLDLFYDFIKWYTELQASILEKRQSQQSDPDEKKKAQKPMREKK